MKASVVCSKKSKPEIILIIFFCIFFYFVYNQRIIIKQDAKFRWEGTRAKCKVSNNSEESSFKVTLFTIFAIFLKIM